MKVISEHSVPDSFIQTDQAYSGRVIPVFTVFFVILLVVIFCVSFALSFFRVGKQDSLKNRFKEALGFLSDGFVVLFFGFFVVCFFWFLFFFAFNLYPKKVYTVTGNVSEVNLNQGYFKIEGVPQKLYIKGKSENGYQNLTKKNRVVSFVCVEEDFGSRFLCSLKE